MNKAVGVVLTKPNLLCRCAGLDIYLDTLFSIDKNAVLADKPKTVESDES
jgi:hypothetical protein